MTDRDNQTIPNVPAAIWLGPYELLDLLTDVGAAAALDGADPRVAMAT